MLITLEGLIKWFIFNDIINHLSVDLKKTILLENVTICCCLQLQFKFIVQVISRVPTYYRVKYIWFVIIIVSLRVDGIFTKLSF